MQPYTLLFLLATAALAGCTESPDMADSGPLEAAATYEGPSTPEDAGEGGTAFASNQSEMHSPASATIAVEECIVPEPAARSSEVLATARTRHYIGDFSLACDAQVSANLQWTNPSTQYMLRILQGNEVVAEAPLENLLEREITATLPAGHYDFVIEAGPVVYDEWHFTAGFKAS